MGPMRCTHRAAASSARSGPPTIHPAARASPAPVVSTTSGTSSAGRSSPSNEQPSAPRLRIHGDARQRAAEHLVLRLVREDDVRLERLHERAKPLGARVSDRAPGGQVDAHARARQARQVDRAYRGPDDRLGEERIAGDVEVVTGRARRVAARPARGGSRHRGRGTSSVPRPVRPATRSRRCRWARRGLSSSTPSASSRSAASRPSASAAALAQPPGGAAQRADPRRDVRRLPAGRQRHPCGRVRAPGDLPVDPHDDVEHEIPEGDDVHRLRSSHDRGRRAARGEWPPERPFARSCSEASSGPPP